VSAGTQGATSHAAAPEAGPQIGVAIGSIGLTPRVWLESARRLDAAGYPSIWSWDHFVGRGDRTVPDVEQWTILAATAAATSRIGLGTFVTNVMNRHPALLARMAGNVQELSGGRLTLGIGIGGGQKEHEAYGMDFPEASERARRLEEAVAVLRALWTGGPVSLDGEFYRLHDAVAHPVPSPTPRILIGAESAAGVRLAARIGDGWAPEDSVFEQLKPAYLEALVAGGRRVEDVSIVVGMSSGRSYQDNLVGGEWTARPAEAWARWHEAGADAVIVTARTTADIDALVGAMDRW
jgi:alkanesulfonate monooxygenase SsuD/methylene tetrahydromethanopterin reductase-like flavin-dependent oxidoreductase (luciferase family)